MEQRSLLQTLRAWEYSRGEFVSSHTLPARQATFTEVSEHLKSFLPFGFDRLYAHQAVALEKGSRGESFTLDKAGVISLLQALLRGGIL